MLKKLNAYILQRSDDYDAVKLTAISRFFRNTALTKEKITAALTLRDIFIKYNDSGKLLNALQQAKLYNHQAESAIHKKYFATKSGFDKSLSEITTLLDDKKSLKRL